MEGEVVSDGFETVAAAATKLMEAAGGGALCIFHAGEPVVDIWAGVSNPKTQSPWQRDDMAMSWSTTKGVASTALHILADRGELDYEEPVTRYWPEFAAGGKQNLTVRQMLAMEAGLYDVRNLIDDPWLMLDHSEMADRLAKATPLHSPGEANAYHAFTYGWLVAELVRRISGTTLGEFVQQEIARPLGLDGFFIGTPVGELDRVAAMPTLKPEPGVLRAIARGVDPVTRLVGLSPKRIAASFLPRRGWEVNGTPEFLAAEVPSVNGVFTARSLATMYAALGSDDGVNGVRLWSPERRAVVAAVQNERRDQIVPIRPRWRLGYHGPFPAKSASVEAFGFYGAYGSGGYADPSRQLAVGFVVQEAKGTPLTKLAPAIRNAVDLK